MNHQKFGRCRTGLNLNSKQIERVKTLFRLYSGKRLDFTNPTIKFVIKNKYFYCRFAIDIEPIQINNFALDIRKLNKNVLTIQDLLKKRTLDPSIAAFLYFSILRRKNITVTGETDTGKTTLINALDFLTPKEFRKIYVEDITESLNQYEYGKHQLKYMVDPSEESLIERYSKSNQIKTLLHRTPDLI
ncbi:MAG: ATPase, T2SS/T4P/T4SS family, partial [Promethearchaeota archaeon]